MRLCRVFHLHHADMRGNRAMDFVFVTAFICTEDPFLCDTRRIISKFVSIVIFARELVIKMEMENDGVCVMRCCLSRTGVRLLLCLMYTFRRNVFAKAQKVRRRSVRTPTELWGQADFHRCYTLSSKPWWLHCDPTHITCCQ